jgi:arylsulfatase A-like enzyme
MTYDVHPRLSIEAAINESRKLNMPEPNMSKPNVIVFFTDQQRWDTTGVHGNPLGLTPNFDRLARTGTDVHYAFTPQPVCGPARSCLQTGRYATNTGVFRNGIILDPGMETLAKCFRAGGYNTGYIGKWHLGDADPVPVEQRGGYDDWLAANLLEFTSDVYDTLVYDTEGQPVRLPGYRVDALTDAAIRYVDKHQAEPFFLFVSYLEPHHQNHLDDYPPPVGYREQYTGRWTPPDLLALGGSSPQHLGGYYGMVKRLDEALGRLLDALRSLHLLENTVVLFTSDHGCHFKTRNAEYKRSCHESSIRVPAALCGPGFDGGGQIDALVSLIDLPPTLLAAAGLPVPPSMEGRSILPLLHGDPHADGRAAREGAPSPWPEEVFVQISESQVARAIRTRRWKYCVDAPERSGWRDAGSDHYVEQALYDLEADPHELTNLAGVDAFRPVADDLRRRLIARMVAAGEAEPVIENAPARAVDQRATNIAEVRQRYQEYLAQP